MAVTLSAPAPLSSIESDSAPADVAAVSSGQILGLAMKKALRAQQARDFPPVQITCGAMWEEFQDRSLQAQDREVLFVYLRRPLVSLQQSRGLTSPRLSMGRLESTTSGLRKKSSGVALAVSENVHHINGDKRDNSRLNLIVLQRGQHSAIHCIQRYRGCHFSAQDILAKFPNAVWLGA